MTDAIKFKLDGKDVEAAPGETIWQVANRLGNEIPHLCWQPMHDYRADGNCRACMVEIKGERVLAASCIRKPAAGMEVTTDNERARTARKMVMELLVADQPRKEIARDPASEFWRWADAMSVETSRFPKRDRQPAPDRSHAAMAVNLDACIQCNLCVRACREVQVNDVIGMAYRGHGAKIVFDFDDPMGESTCVACGECVQACPTGALMPASVMNDKQERTGYADREVESLCPYCGVGCQITYEIKDDRILWVEGRNGPSNHGRLCVKGRFGFDYVTHPQRLTEPMIRRDDAPKDPNIEIDPANPWTHFRKATWDEALARAAEGLKTIRDRDGANALAGFGSAKGSNEEAYLFQKLVRVGFGTNNVDHCTRLCHASSVAALMEGINSGAVTAPFMAAKDADCIFVIGANPTVNHPVAATFLKQAAKDGKTLIILDPRGSSLSRHATHMLQFKPGQDVALLNAMLHTIINEGFTDQQYVEGYTEGFEELRKKIQAFPPEKMAAVCGIDAETIKMVARKYATSRASIIFWGMGISQHIHGTDNARCLISLALTTGQIGRPGTGLHPLRGQNNVQGASDAGLIPMVFPDYQRVNDPTIRDVFENAWGTKLDPTPGLTVVEIMNAIHADKLKGMYIMGENPAMSDPDLNHARGALAKLEHLVVQDIFLTETAWHADVILPASAFPEKDGSFTNTNRQVQLGRKALPLPGNARQDWELIQELAQLLGLDWNYAHPREVFAEMASVMPSMKNITWARLERESSVTYPCDAEDKPGNEIMFAAGFPTATGRGKLVPTSIVPPDELPDDEFPLVLTTGRMLEHWHTGAMTRRASTLDALEPEAVASMSPREIGKRGWQPGDRIRVETRRGQIELTVRADRDVPEGMVFIPFCFAEAAANMLTNPALDPYGKIPEFKFCAARVSRVGDGASAQAAE
jgi:formate dehydrogenase major subunit